MSKANDFFRMQIPKRRKEKRKSPQGDKVD